MVRFVSLILLALALSMVVPPLCAEGKPIVVATTSVLASIVRDLAGDKVVVEIVASPAVCPAHYDVKPSDVEKFRRASLILYHGFEPWVKDLVKASGTRAPLVRVSGPWNTPDRLKRMYVEVAKALEKYLGIDVNERLQRCLRAIDETGRWLKEFAREHGFVGIPVVVMLWQKPFVSYLGFKVVAVYGPPERVTPSELSKVIENATKARALLVIDNLQSGTDLGRKIAEEVGAIEVALTNFPGVAPGVSNVTEMMKYNAKLLAQALEAAGWRSSVKELRSEVTELRHELALASSEVESWRMAFVASAAVNVVLAIIVAILYKRLRGA